MIGYQLPSENSTVSHDALRSTFRYGCIRLSLFCLARGGEYYGDIELFGFDWPYVSLTFWLKRLTITRYFGSIKSRCQDGIAGRISCWVQRIYLCERLGILFYPAWQLSSKTSCAKNSLRHDWLNAPEACSSNDLALWLLSNSICAENDSRLVFARARSIQSYPHRTQHRWLAYVSKVRALSYYK